jgi:hypothetical protein
MRSQTQPCVNLLSKQPCRRIACRSVGSIEWFAEEAKRTCGDVLESPDRTRRFMVGGREWWAVGCGCLALELAPHVNWRGVDSLHAACVCDSSHAPIHTCCPALPALLRCRPSSSPWVWWVPSPLGTFHSQ